MGVLICKYTIEKELSSLALSLSEVTSLPLPLSGSGKSVLIFGFKILHDTYWLN